MGDKKKQQPYDPYVPQKSYFDGVNPFAKAFYSDAYKGMPTYSVGAGYGSPDLQASLALDNMNPRRENIVQKDNIGVAGSLNYQATPNLSFFAKGQYSPNVEFLNQARMAPGLVKSNPRATAEDIQRATTPYQFNDMKASAGLSYDF